MTIKAFSHLCGCNPQTLRYYDHVGLLKPVKVDKWSGYRCYEEEQAFAYVKIKNLQKAGFTIEEIKALLDKDNQAIYEAFSAKIDEQEKRLLEIRRIQRSYQTEMNEINKKLEEIRAFVTKNMEEYDPSEEFGLSEEAYRRVIDNVCTFFDSMINGEADPGFEDMCEEAAGTDEAMDFLDNPEYEIVFEKHGWKYVKDFFKEFSNLEDGQEYALVFRLVPGKTNEMAFANTMLGTLLQTNPEKRRKLGCNVKEDSKDGQNHFWLLKKKRT